MASYQKIDSATFFFDECGVLSNGVGTKHDWKQMLRACAGVAITS
jgi:hypothetical protein